MNLKNNISKVKYNLRRYGVSYTLNKINKRIFHVTEERKNNLEDYKEWILENEPAEEELERQKMSKLLIEPKFSIVVPMYNTNETFFKELVQSLKDQTYSNWELCFADGSNVENPEYKKYIDDERIKYKFLNSNKGISENTNEAIKMATGDFIGFLDHDDLLTENALFEMALEINRQKGDVDLLYSDEDKIDEEGVRFEPHFKPDFSPETLECNNYITHFVIIKTEFQKKIGLLNSEFDGAQDFDFLLRALENTKKVKHISKVLYHWRVNRGSTADTADSKPYAFEAGLKAAQEHLKRSKKEGIVTNGEDVPGIYKIKYKILGNPKVSILIPNKDNIKLLKNCIDSIFENTSYDNYEIVIIENNSKKKETFKFYDKITKNSKVKLLKYENKIKEFNYSSLINFGVKNVDGDFILQLNNDTKIINKEWLEIALGYAQNKEIGAVGGRLYYEDKTIQHAGITIGLSGIAGNMLVNLPFGEHAYFGQEAATRNVSAITGAFLLCRKELYAEVGFMNETEFKVSFNDVDFCLKLIEKGYRNLYIPYIELYHYESKTRGYEYTKEQEERFKVESSIFKSKWGDYKDPYYNKNFSLETCNYDLNIVVNKE